MTTAATQSTEENHLGVLDGLRGLMALWVFFGHVFLNTSGKDTPWGSAGIAVDVFMLLSGFLMAYHWELRSKRFGNSFRAQTIDFYTRRFFRIAPLYYLLVSVAFIWQPELFELQQFVSNANPPPWADQLVAHISLVEYERTLPNLLSHYTFLFGFFPQYSSNNMLPDWSIGLEMQFYLLFPLLMVFISRFGRLTTVVVVLALTLLTNKLFGLYLDQGRLGNFPQPSFILFKLDIFLVGICMAFAYFNRNKLQCVPWIVMAALACLRSAIQVKYLAFFLAFIILFDEKRVEFIHKLASGRLAKFIGDTSYSVYLLHLLILFPALYVLLHQGWFTNLTSYQRAGVAFVIIAVPVYGISYLLYRFIELPGIEMGRRLLRSRMARTMGPVLPVRDGPSMPS